MNGGMYLAWADFCNQLSVQGTIFRRWWAQLISLNDGRAAWPELFGSCSCIAYTYRSPNSDEGGRYACTPWKKEARHSFSKKWSLGTMTPIFFIFVLPPVPLSTCVKQWPNYSNINNRDDVIDAIKSTYMYLFPFGCIVLRTSIYSHYYCITQLLLLNT